MQQQLKCTSIVYAKSSTFFPQVPSGVNPIHYVTQVLPSIFFFACKIGDFKIADLVCLHKSLFTLYLTAYFFNYASTTD